MTDLRRINAKLDYNTVPVPVPYGMQTRLFRCTLEVPYPERVTVVGEGTSKKDAEKRCAAACCLKLMVCNTLSLSPLQFSWQSMT